jgi:hypothetical protein
MNDLCILVCELLSIIMLSKWQFCHSSLSFHVLACETNFCALCLVGSVLSQYGVHSFPVVFVHNRTSRVRYHGSRTLEDFVYFYQNYTGLRSVSGGQVVKHADCGFAKLVFNVGKGVKEVCPYPWAISPQNWLQEDAYLTLAFLFLILRLLYILLPIVASAWTLY